MKIKKLVTLAMLLAVAVICGYIEAMLPIDIGIPGVKLGLANIVTFIILYIYGAREGLLVGVLRILIVGFMFTNLSMIIYSMSGFVVSFILMTIFKRSDIFSRIGVSVIGAVAHNMTQIGVAAVLTGLYGPLVMYIPVLLISGFLTGAFIGFLGDKCLPLVEKIKVNND